MSSISSTLDKINMLFKKKVGSSIQQSSTVHQKGTQVGLKIEGEEVVQPSQQQLSFSIDEFKPEIVQDYEGDDGFKNIHMGEERVIPFEGQMIDISEYGGQSVHHDMIQKKVARIAMASKTQKRPDSMKTKRQLIQEKEEERMKQKIMRKSAGEVWSDPNMALWQDNDYRIFCGNLGNEVTDDVLSNSFKRYHSFSRARVVRDKRSQKTKGYGFVSFLDPQDFLKALKEMNGKYIGNRPVKLTKSEWDERAFVAKQHDEIGNKFLKKGIKKTKSSIKH